jgi:hypothetical protein
VRGARARTSGAGALAGSWIGRATSALPALLAAAGIGLVLVGATGRVELGALVTGLLATVTMLRAARTGVTIDVERHEVVLRTFWRTRRVDAAALARVDTLERRTDGASGVRFVLRDGREYGAPALAYLAARASERLLADLGALTEDDPFDVVLVPPHRHLG